jgi:DNA-binding transcriptional regulator YdaS (Cro superfamily)
MTNTYKKQAHEGLIKAIEEAGGQRALAKLCGDKVSQGHVYNWLHRNKNKGLPPQYVLKIEKALGGKLTRYQLRPDIFTEMSITTKP